MSPLGSSSSLFVTYNHTGYNHSEMCEWMWLQVQHSTVLTHHWVWGGIKLTWSFKPQSSETQLFSLLLSYSLMTPENHGPEGHTHPSSHIFIRIIQLPLLAFMIALFDRGTIPQHCPLGWGDSALAFCCSSDWHAWTKRVGYWHRHREQQFIQSQDVAMSCFWCSIEIQTAPRPSPEFALNTQKHTN